MTTTATKTAENEEDIAIVVDLIRAFHESGEDEDFDSKLARELGRLAPETVLALADALTSNVPIIAVTPQSGLERDDGGLTMTNSNPHPHDRAAVVTTAVLQIVRGALLAWLHHDSTDPAGAHAEIEAVLRTEFDDIAHTTATEIRREDE